MSGLFTDLLSEREKTNAWRASELLKAGYDPDTAEKLACRWDIDLHVACELVTQRSCPPALAAEILL